jgi:hypothetical protein
VRSVEATLELFDGYRSPVDPSRRVSQVVLAGEPAHVLATAQGVRDLEYLRGEPFGFALAACRASAERTAALGCTVADALADDARPFALLLIDADEAMAATPAGRRALQAARSLRATHAPAATVVVLRHGARLAPGLADGGHGPFDLVRYDGHNPLLLPALEGILADAAPACIALGGRGERLAGAALGAGDFFLERAGDPTRLTARDRTALAARACVLAGLACDAPDLAAFAVAPALDRLRVARVDGPYDAAAQGVLVYPVEG